MSQIQKSSSHPATVSPLRKRSSSPASEGEDNFGLNQLLAAFRRRLVLIAASCGVFLTAALVYSVLASPQYEASTSLIFEATAPISAAQSATGEVPLPQSDMIDSQVEVLRSDDTVLDMIDRLDLANDPDFTEPRSLVTRLRRTVSSLVQVLGSPEGEDTTEPREVALRAVRRDLEIARVGTTYLVQVSFASSNPAKAARIANGLVESYLDRQANARQLASEQTTTWLSQRSNDLWQRYVAVDRQIQDLRAGVAQNASPEQAIARLSLLENEAASYRKLHQQFQELQIQSLDRQASGSLTAQVVSSARAPTEATSPRKALTLVLALVLGGFVGIALAMGVELFDRSLRSGRDVRRQLGISHLGMLADLTKRADAGPIARLLKKKGRAELVQADLVPFADQLRAVQAALDNAVSGRGPKILGVVSTLPAEGSSTVAESLARLLAGSGASTLLIDTAGEASGPTYGRTGAASVFWPEPSLAAAAKLTHVAASIWRTGVRNEPLLGSVVERARSAVDLDYVVVDLAPMGPFADAEAAAPAIDCFVLVVDWGRTPAAVVRTALERNPDVRDKCIGALLNKVDVSRVRSHDAYESSDSYR